MIIKRPWSTVIITILAGLFFGLIIFVLSDYNDIRDQNVGRLTLYNPSSSKTAVEEKGIEVFNMFKQIRDDAILQTKDDDFLKYIHENLDIKCPFYQPDGVTYRMCLGEVLTDYEDKLFLDTKVLENIENYCTNMSEPYQPGVGAYDIYTSCMIYKIVKNVPN